MLMLDDTRMYYDDKRACIFVLRIATNIATVEDGDMMKCIEFFDDVEEQGKDSWLAIIGILD